MDWETVYEEMKNENIMGTGISGVQTIKKVRQINEENRSLFIEYHKMMTKNLKDIFALQMYKYERTILFNFLLDEQINNIPLKQTTQQQINEFFIKFISEESKDKYERKLNTIKKFFNFHKGVFINDISFDFGKLSDNINTDDVEQVPEWPGYYPNLEDATDSQKEFYYRWLENFQKGICIDVKGVLAYLYIYIYSIIEDFIKDKDINGLGKKLDKIVDGYGQYDSIRGHIDAWLADAYLWLGEYDKCWNIISKSKISFENVLNIKPKCRDTSIDGDEFMLIVGNKQSLTQLGQDNLNAIKHLSEIFLKDFQVQNGSNIIEYFVNHFDFWNLSDRDFDELKEYITLNDNKMYKDRNYSTKKEWFETLKQSHLKRSQTMNLNMKKYMESIKDPSKFAPLKRNDFENLTEYKKYLKNYAKYCEEKLEEIQCGRKHLFSGIAGIETPSITYMHIPQIISEALIGKLQQILRECENTYREESGIPKIGEGWVNETYLYYRIKEAFPKEKIVHHGRPHWLGKQHIDMYFSEKNIGIEYQGEQHSQPIDYFGGIESFTDQQSRDKRKWHLCSINNCRLIYVYPGYDFIEVKKKIEQYL